LNPKKLKPHSGSSLDGAFLFLNQQPATSNQQLKKPGFRRAFS
jgi:hypothetical protein